MNKKLIVFVMLLTAFISAQADNVLTVKSDGIPKGANGTFAVELSNPDQEFAALHMTITLPEGLSYVNSEKADRLANHSAYGCTPDQSNSKILYINSYNSPTAAITGTSGALFYITVSAGASITAESVNVSISDVTFSQADGETQWTGTNADYSVNIIDGIVLDEESTVLPVSQTNVNVTVKRTLVGGKWNTMCLPFALTKELADAAFGSDATFCYLDEVNVEETSIELSFANADLSGGIDPNYPFIVKPTSDKTELPFNNVSISADEGQAQTQVNFKRKENMKNVDYATFIGTLRDGTTIPADNIFLGAGDNKFYYSDGSTTIKGFRGYFYLKDFKSSAGARQLKLMVDGEETTAIEGLYINGEPATVEGVYNLKGQRVDTPTQKGVYIKDGKKVVIK